MAIVITTEVATQSVATKGGTRIGDTTGSKHKVAKKGDSGGGADGNNKGGTKFVN